MAEAPLKVGLSLKQPSEQGGQDYMTSRTRLWVLAVSTPIIAFAIVGGYLGRVLGAGKDDTFRQLPVFEDVISLVLNNYVEEVDVRHAMRGALKGLADGLDPDSAYLTPDLVKAVESGQPAGAGDVGLVVTRQTTCASCRRVMVRPPPRPGSAPATSSGASTTGPHATCRRSRARGCWPEPRAARSSCLSSAATRPSRTTWC